MGNTTSDERGTTRDTGDKGVDDSSSAFVEAVRFQNELADMQRALQSLYVAPCPALLPHQVAIDGAVVTCDPGVHVLVGPVVGKVDFQTARVLLEVSARARITCHVSTVNTLTKQVEELPQCRCVVLLEAQQPAVFRIERLAPGREYRVSFSGVRRQDAETRRGSFRTPTLETGTSELRAIAVNGDDPADLQAGEQCVWKSVRQHVEQKSVDCVLHLGGQVAMQRMFDYASLLLLRHASSSVRDGEGAIDWRGIEARAVEVLRGAYRTQWSLSSDVQFVLANASNLMMWSDADVYPHFTTRKEFYIDHDQPTLQMQVIRTVTRCARRLFLEYQRQLWDDDMESLLDREKEMVAVAERALQSSGKIFTLSQQIPKVMRDLELQKQRREIEGARRVEKQLRALEAEKLKLERQLVSYNQLMAPQRGEEFVYSIGVLTLLFLDLRSARLESGGSQAADNSLLSPLQWDFVERVLEQDNTRLLVVCTELPVVDEGLADRGAGAEDYKKNATAWSNNSEAQVRLLSALFDWKLERPNREFVLLSGSGQLGPLSANTVIKDVKLRTEAIQYTVSGITAGSSDDSAFMPLIGIPCSKMPLLRPLASKVLHSRFCVEHASVNTIRKGFAVLSLTCGANSAAPAIQVGQMDGSDIASGARSRVVVGPVIGWVDAHSATVLLEIDRDADLACVIDNPFTGERRKFFQRFRAYRPNSFFLTRLRSEHWYQVSFSNIECPGDFTATFATPALIPDKLEVVAMCNDAALLSANASTGDSNSMNTTTLWEALAEQTAGVPFCGIDLVLHLGGQFFPDSSTQVRQALLMADELCRDSVTTIKEESLEVTHISEKLRELYRLGWSAPGVREQLASGSHIFMVNQNDLLPRSVASSQPGLLVQQQLRQVHHEYSDLLLPPLMRRDEVLPRTIAQRFGSFGTFVLPVQGPGGDEFGRFISPQAWEDLDAVLADENMQVLLLVTTEPVVQESPGDTMEQAKVHSEYRSQFGFHQRDLERLLTALFRWQQSQLPAPGQTGNLHTSASKRHAALLSGNKLQSFDSVIQNIKSSAPAIPAGAVASSDLPSVEAVESSQEGGMSIHQFVVGPLSAPPVRVLPNCNSDATHPHPLLFLEGALFGQYVYRHSRVLRQATSGTSNDMPENPFKMAYPNESVENRSLSVTTITELGEQLPQCQYLRMTLSLNKGSSTTPYVFSQFISRDPVQPRVQADQTDRENDNGASVRVTYESVDATTSHEDGPELPLKMNLPAWLLELLHQPLTTEEQTQIEERAGLLRDKAAAITATFEQSSTTANSLLSVSIDVRGYIAELIRLFAEFYNHLDPTAREKFMAPPSSLVVRIVLYRVCEDPAFKPLIAGAIDADAFERLLSRCYLDGWVIRSRLAQLFTGMVARQEEERVNSIIDTQIDPSEELKISAGTASKDKTLDATALQRS